MTKDEENAQLRRDLEVMFRERDEGHQSAWQMLKNWEKANARAERLRDALKRVCYLLQLEHDSIGKGNHRPNCRVGAALEIVKDALSGSQTS